MDSVPIVGIYIKRTEYDVLLMATPVMEFVTKANADHTITNVKSCGEEGPRKRTTSAITESIGLDPGSDIAVQQFPAVR